MQKNHRVGSRLDPTRCSRRPAPAEVGFILGSVGFFRGEAAHDPPERSGFTGHFLAQPVQTALCVLRGFLPSKQGQGRERCYPGAFRQAGRARPGAIGQLSDGKVTNSVRYGFLVLRSGSAFGERDQRPCGRLRAADGALMKTPSAILVLRAQQEGETRILNKCRRHAVLKLSRCVGAQKRVPIQARSPALGDLLGSWKSVFQVCEKIVFFELANFKLIDEPVEISARHAQASRAFHFVPAKLAESAKNEPALELADFALVGTVGGHAGLGAAECFRFMGILADIQR